MHMHPVVMQLTTLLEQCSSLQCDVTSIVCVQKSAVVSAQEGLQQSLTVRTRATSKVSEL